MIIPLGGNSPMSPAYYANCDLPDIDDWVRGLYASVRIGSVEGLMEVWVEGYIIR